MNSWEAAGDVSPVILGAHIHRASAGRPARLAVHPAKGYAYCVAAGGPPIRQFAGLVALRQTFWASPSQVGWVGSVRFGANTFQLASVTTVTVPAKALAGPTSALKETAI